MLQVYSAGFCCVVFFFNDTATTEIYTLSLHDALPIWRAPCAPGRCGTGFPAVRPRRARGGCPGDRCRHRANALAQLQQVLDGALEVFRIERALVERRGVRAVV